MRWIGLGAVMDYEFQRRIERQQAEAARQRRESDARLRQQIEAGKRRQEDEFKARADKDERDRQRRHDKKRQQRQHEETLRQSERHHSENVKTAASQSYATSQIVESSRNPASRSFLGTIFALIWLSVKLLLKLAITGIAAFAVWFFWPDIINLIESLIYI